MNKIKFLVIFFLVCVFISDISVFAVQPGPVVTERKKIDKEKEDVKEPEVKKQQPVPNKQGGKPKPQKPVIKQPAYRSQLQMGVTNYSKKEEPKVKTTCPTCLYPKHRVRYIRKPSSYWQ